MTEETLDEEIKDYAGKLRDNDRITVMDSGTGEIIYDPPSHTKIKELMSGLINFANEEEPFIHPVIKASVIHFYFSYVHPFMDGNGRTARALFYYYMIKNGYPSMEFVSISHLIHENRNRYYKVFEDVEKYDDDLTYFLNFSIEITYKAFQALQNRTASKLKFALVEERIREENLPVNKRQLKVLRNFISGKYNELNVQKVQKISKVSYETARIDLNQLVEWGFLEKQKKGKKYHYYLLME